MIKISRRFVYVVEGQEYSDQKAAQAAAKEANAKEKIALLTHIIEANTLQEAVEIILARFHVYSKNPNKNAPGVKRNEPVSSEKLAN